MDVNRFIELCDEVGLKQGIRSRSTKEAYDEIYNLCQHCIKEVGRVSRTLRKHIIFENIFNDVSLTYELKILELILDAARPRDELSSIEEVAVLRFDRWEDIIEIAFSARESSHFFRDELMPYRYQKEINFAKSCKNLSLLGIEFRREGDDVLIKEESYEDLLKIIQSYVNRIGGIDILDYSFQSLSRNYKPDQQRFHIARNVTQRVEVINPDIPWGYLIALGVKNIHVTPVVDGKESLNEYKKLVTLMTDVVATFEIQIYSIWESIFVENYKIIEFIQQNILYDNLVSFPQMNGDYVIDIIECISSRWGVEQSYDLSLSDIIKVGISIIKLAETQSIVTIGASNISKDSGIKLKKTIEIIKKIYICGNDNKLGFPPAAEAMDYIVTPLLPFLSQYILLPRSLVSLAVFNSIISQISRPNGDFDNKKDGSIGGFLEDFVWEKINQHKIKGYRGEFKSKDKSIEGDCDLLIKKDDCIFIFEVKKKSLTRKSISGIDLHIIKDLSDSLMRSQSQCSKIEYLLLSDREITLINDNRSEVISYNDERIFKVSLSLYDFGSLQSSNVLATILGLSTQVSFIVKDTSDSMMIRSWDKYLNILIKYTEESRKLQDSPDDFFRSHIFMSIPQLLTILDDSNNEDELLNLCKAAQHMTYGTGCFYIEYSLRKSLFQG